MYYIFFDINYISTFIFLPLKGKVMIEKNQMCRFKGTGSEDGFGFC